MAPATQKVDIDGLVAQLTIKEKISLLAGLNFWETVPIPRLNIPSLKVSDGPNGARGASFRDGPTAACFPASVSLASTWDFEIAQRIGKALAEETKTKGAMVLLGPTVCPHRSPLGGRNFESFSEDPYLAGKMAATYIKGLQSEGVGATIKHFAGNEQETRRFTMNVNIGERALREIYLKPFEIAIKEANPWALMTSYNKLNGYHADMSEYLLKTVLRGQWGYDGLVMSDWGGTNSVAESITAGLDLEMPGPANHRKIQSVTDEIASGKLKVESIDARVKTVLTLLEKTGKFENPETPAEASVILPEHSKLIREAGANGIVLLKNEGNILPLKKDKLKTIAALGLAKECLAHGGGSASVNCHYKVTPFEALERELDGKVELRYAPGATLFRNLPAWKSSLFDLTGAPGLTISHYATNDTSKPPTLTANNPTASYTPMSSSGAGYTLSGTYKCDISGNHYVSFAGMGIAKFYINDKLVLETTKNCDDPMGFLVGVVEEQMIQYQFYGGQEYKIYVESWAPVKDPSVVEENTILDGLSASLLGFVMQHQYEEDLLAGAVEVAKGADVALVFVGNTTVWETEGQDQKTMDLPAYGSQDALIRAVAAVNPKTVVINSTGVAINMPWLSSVPAFMQAWFAGQEAGNAIVDVLLGAVNPGGKLPVTFPRSLEDTPSYGNFPGDVEALQVYYKENLDIGYRYYDKYPEKALFPFGFGLSYSRFEISGVGVEKVDLVKGGQVQAKATVANVGELAGSEVVQFYISPPASAVERPKKELAGFVKVALGPGEKKTVGARIDYQSAAYWDEKASEWVVEKGVYEVLVGNSSQSISGKGSFEVKERFSYAA